MKKKLEADLISIAHRILQLKNKSDINQLYLETQKLYEKLSVLRFVDEHFSEVKPTIGTAEIEQKLSTIFDDVQPIEPETGVIKDEIAAEEIIYAPQETAPEVEVELNNEEIDSVELPVEELISDVTETPQQEEPVAAENEAVSFRPDFDLIREEAEEIDVEVEKKEAEVAEKEIENEIEVPKKQEPIQISFEDLLGGNYHDTHFVKVQQIENIPTTIVIETPKEVVPDETEAAIIEEVAEPKIVSLNDKLAKGINIDLNDRIAFIKHLFGNSSEDYNRVLNQLITFNTFYETRDFIQEMVKPDYNNWEGKQDYEERFMDIIEKKFL